MSYIKNRRRVWTGRVTRVDEVGLDFGNGCKPTYEVITFNSVTGVSALPIEGNNVWLIKHYQTGINTVGYSLPTGGLGLNENPTERMQLELQEELGYKAGKLTLMFRSHIMPGYIGTDLGYVFLAENLIQSQLKGDEDYPIKIERMRIDVALNLIKQGEITDSRTMLALLYYQTWFSK